MPDTRMLRHTATALFRFLMRVVPARGQVFVASFPSDEGNAVELVRSLIQRYPGDIIWVDSPEPDRLRDLGLEPDRIIRLAKRSPAAIVAFLRSAAVFSTHGVYGCPRPVQSKALVNIWHGDGPKGYAGAPVYSTFLVSGSGMFGRYRATEFKVASDGLLLTGLPRTRQLRHPASGDALRQLGIDPERPFVVWLPTVRKAAAAGVNPARSDVDTAGDDVDIAQAILPGAGELAALGIQLVVKPHPSELMSTRFDVFTSISDAGIVEARTSLYALLGASGGLITDYGSVWTDYLAIDHPIGFFMPDLEAYQRGRGLHPDTLSHLPGLALDDPVDFAAFGREILGDASGPGPALREQGRDHFEMVHPPSPADSLLTELDRRGVLAMARVESPVEQLEPRS